MQKHGLASVWTNTQNDTLGSGALTYVFSCCSCTYAH